MILLLIFLSNRQVFAKLVEFALFAWPECVKRGQPVP